MYTWFRLLVIISFLNIQVVEAATTYYVQQSGGSDSNPGTQALPWLTLKKATDSSLIQPGDTVIVGPGTYIDTASTWEQAFTPFRSGTAGLPITFRSEPPLAAIVSPNPAYTTTGHLGAMAPAFGPQNRNYIVIDGFRATGRISFRLGNHCTIQNNVVTGGGWESDATLIFGISLYRMDDCLIKNNTVSTLVNSTDGTSGGGILNNYSHNTSAFMVGWTSNRNVLEYNTADCVTQDGHRVYSGFGQKGEGTHDTIYRYNIAKRCQVAFHAIGSTSNVYQSTSNTWHHNLGYDMVQGSQDLGGVFLDYAQQVDPTTTSSTAYNNTAYAVAGFHRNEVGLGTGGDCCSGHLTAYNNIGYLTLAPKVFYRSEPSATYSNWTLLLLAGTNYNLMFGQTYVATRNYGSDITTTLANWITLSGHDTNSISGSDPLFTNIGANDFTLQAGSPAKNAGLGGVDMGAYQGVSCIGYGCSGGADVTPPAAPTGVVITQVTAGHR